MQVQTKTYSNPSSPSESLDMKDFDMVDIEPETYCDGCDVAHIDIGYRLEEMHLGDVNNDLAAQEGELDHEEHIKAGADRRDPKSSGGETTSMDRCSRFHSENHLCGSGEGVPPPHLEARDGPHHQGPPHHGPPHRVSPQHGPPHRSPPHHRHHHHGPPTHAPPHHAPPHHGPPHHKHIHPCPPHHGPPGSIHQHRGPPQPSPPHHGSPYHSPAHHQPCHHEPPHLSAHHEPPHLSAHHVNLQHHQHHRRPPPLPCCSPTFGTTRRGPAFRGPPLFRRGCDSSHGSLQAHQMPPHRPPPYAHWSHRTRPHFPSGGGEHCFRPTKLGGNRPICCRHGEQREEPFPPPPFENFGGGRHGCDAHHCCPTAA